MRYPTFPEALSPRIKYRPLKNTFNIASNCTDCNPQLSFADFHVVLYYRSKNSFEVRVRRLDYAKWNFNIHLHLHNLGQKDEGELHVIGPSNSSYKAVTLTAHIKLEEISELELLSPQNIPRIIIQTYYTTNATNIHHWNAFQTFVESNSEYEVLLMLDKHCRIFIKKHFPSRVLRAYDALVPKAFKADLFRYCYLYLRGGCYFDNKMINRSPLRNTIKHNDSFLVCSDTLPYGIEAKTLKDTKKLYNAVICSAPMDDRMLKAIKYVVNSVNSKNYQSNDLGITGPVAFYEATKHWIDDSNVRFSHKLGRAPYISVWFPNGHADHNNGGREYRDYTVNEKTNHEPLLTKFFQNYSSSAHRRYGDLWKQGKVFYETSYKAPPPLKDLRLFIEPGILPYYTVSFIETSIVVEKRTFWNSNFISIINEEFKQLIRKYILFAGHGGLTNKIELKLIDEENDEEYYLSLNIPTHKKPRTVYSIKKYLL